MATSTSARRTICDKDAESGVEELLLTEEQRQEIAEIKRVYAAKAAEAEILHKSKLMTVWEPEERAKLDQGHRRDLERFELGIRQRQARERATGAALRVRRHSGSEASRERRGGNNVLHGPPQRNVIRTRLSVGPAPPPVYWPSRPTGVSMRPTTPPPHS